MAEPKDITEEQLVAFADEELSPEQVEALRPLIEGNAELSRRVEEYRESGDILTAYFQETDQKKTPDKVAEKIRSLGRDQQKETDTNVVSLGAFRRGAKKSVAILSGSYGFQKIAASLVVGIAIGGVGLQMAGTGFQQQGTLYRGMSEKNNENLTCKKVDFKNCPPVSFELLNFHNPLEKFSNGRIINILENYKIQLKVKEPGQVTLLFKVPGKGTQTLISQAVRKENILIEYPPVKHFKFPDGEPFIPFLLKWSKGKNNDQRYYSLGLVNE